MSEIVLFGRIAVVPREFPSELPRNIVVAVHNSEATIFWVCREKGVLGVDSAAVDVT